MTRLLDHVLNALLGPFAEHLTPQPRPVPVRVRDDRRPDPGDRR